MTKPKLSAGSGSPRRSAPRFHVTGGLGAGAEITLPERAARHVSVLRLQVGDEITLFNGEGGEYRAVLTGLQRDRTRARLAEHLQVERESLLDITLAQCMSAGERMDWVLQKATELGVTRIVPIASERSVVRLSAERAARKLGHWRNVVSAACEQCGRNRIPGVAEAVDLPVWLATLSGSGARLALAPDAPNGLSRLAPGAAVILLVGPEGGLTAQERAAAERHGFASVRLGPRVLRTETAPLAALTAMQTLWGDFA